MTNVFSKFKNMNDQLSNAPSTMFLRCLVMFLHFDTYVFEIPVSQSGVFSQNVDFIRSDKASYQNVRHGFGTPKGHTFDL